MELSENVKESHPEQPHHQPTIRQRMLSVSGATFLSRIMGFVRDMLIAYSFGTGVASDLFYIGYRIPNMLRELFAEGTLSSAFIPQLTRTLKEEGRERASRMMTSVGILILLILLCILAAGEVLAPTLLDILAPGYASQPSTRELGTTLIRIMFPFLLFISFSAIAMGSLNVQGKFFVPALSPAFFSCGLIVGTILPPSLTLGHRVYGLGFGVLLGGLFQWMVQWHPLRKGIIHLDGTLTLQEAWKDSDARKVLRLLLPSIGGLWVTQGNLLIATFFGSLLVSGTISALYYAMRLVQFPLGLIGAAIATVLLPVLSQQRMEENGVAKNIRTLAESYRLSLFFMIPASAGLMALAPPLIRLLFEHGSFSSLSAVLTQKALWGFAIGLWSFSGVRILVRVYYAHQDTRFPVWAAFWGLVTNFGLSFLFYRSAGIFALAIGISAGSLVNHLVIFTGLKRYLGKTPWEIFGNLFPVLGISGVLFAVVRLIWTEISRFHVPHGSLSLVAEVIPTILAGVVLYMGMAYLLGVREGVSIVRGFFRSPEKSA
ncbi:MAG: murein biosynthesis integral membrane protein MurJ [Leptospirillum sp.]